MLLNFLQRTGQPVMTKNDPVQDANGAEVEKLCSSVGVTNLGITRYN